MQLGMDTAGLRDAFLKAASRGDMRTLKKVARDLENREGEVIWSTIKGPKGNTALHFAASSGKAYMCKYLVEKMHIDVNTVNEIGHSPLHEAVLGQDRQTTKYLLESGADVTQTSNKGYTPLHYAAEKGSRGVMQLLISKGAEIHVQCEAGTPLHCAAAQGNKEALEFLLQKKADPNIISRLRFSPLLLSILAESLDCVKLLLKAGADPNVGGHGITSLSYAVAENETEVIKCLLESGADPNITDGSGLTPLENAALVGDLDEVMLLFPLTSRISSYPDWSIRGIMKHVHSKEARAERELRKKAVFQSAKAKGGEAFKQKDYLDAMYWYTMAFEIDGLDATILSNRSLCWYHLKEGEYALADAEVCAELRPDWPKAHYRVGAAWKLLKNYPMAAQSFNLALALDPDNDEIKKAYREVVEEML